MTSEYPEMEYLSSVQPISLHNAKKALAVLESSLFVLDGHLKSPGRYLVV